MKKNFVYLNLNPYRIEENDCVCRAIELGTKVDYFVVDKLLNLLADYHDCDKLCVCCYQHLLEDIFGFPVRYCDKDETVEDIASMYPHNRLIIRVDGHLTSSVNGVIYDLWDCSKKFVDCYWICS